MINYLRLGASVEFYLTKGYTRLESPWYVPVEIMNLTLPKNKHPEESLFFIPKNQKALVASGEQSLLYLASKQLLPNKKIQTITPCFRDDEQDKYHQKYFMKNELMIPFCDDDFILEEMINNALDFFKTQFPESEKLNVVKTSEGFDIEYNGIEIGSYGIRQNTNLSWIYGTGCAEPRMSSVIQG